MNNDTFAARLRQHLLDSADERPSPDQLAIVRAGVAATPQRRPIGARLRWNPGPTARYGLIALALVGVLVAALLFATGAGPTPPTTTRTPATTPTTTPAPKPTVSPGPGGPTVDPSSCTQFEHEATYSANVGTLPVGVIVPATSSSPWAAVPDEFALINAPCGGSGTVWFNAALVARVYADSCHWRRSTVEAPTVPDVVAKLLTQPGHETSDATDTHVGAFRATRLDLSVPADFHPIACDNGVLGLWETRLRMRTIDPGTTIQVYVAEVDGLTLVVTAGYHSEGATPEVLAEIDAILATLRVDI